MGNDYEDTDMDSLRSKIEGQWSSFVEEDLERMKEALVDAV